MRILIINPFGIGDVLFSTPVIAALKNKFPDSSIAYACNSLTGPILENNPHIDKLLFFSRGDFKKIRRQSFLKYIKTFIAALREIRKQKFDLAIDLSMVTQYSLVLRLLGVPKIYGFDYKKRGRFLTDKIFIQGFSGKHVVDHYADLLIKLGVKDFKRCLSFYLSNEDKQWADDFLKQNNITKDDVLVGIAPFGGLSWGGDAENKQWPLASYVFVIKQIIKKHKVKVILFGTKNDLSRTEFFNSIKNDKQIINAAGKTSLGQLAALINKSGLFVSNDSGPLHIACALDIKTVSIYGPVDEKVYGPVGDEQKHNIVCADIDCRPCYNNFKKPECANMNCLKLLDKEKVLTEVEKQLLIKEN